MVLLLAQLYKLEYWLGLIFVVFQGEDMNMFSVVHRWAEWLISDINNSSHWINNQGQFMFAILL